MTSTTKINGNTQRFLKGRGLWADIELQEGDCALAKDGFMILTVHEEVTAEDDYRQAAYADEPQIWYVLRPGSSVWQWASSGHDIVGDLPATVSVQEVDSFLKAYADAHKISKI